jgi:hypothetical protein
MRSVKRFSVAFWATFSFLLIFAAWSSGPVMAAQDALVCPADRINSNGNICTAADVSLAAAAVSVSQTGLTCFPGEVISVALVGNVDLRKGDRFDIGIWISTDGKPMGLRGGSGAGIPDEGGAQSCEVVPLPYQQIAKDGAADIIIDSFDSIATPQDCYDTKAANNGDVSTNFILTSERDSIINGQVDSNNDGVIDITDDTTGALLPLVFGAQIVAGGVDINNDGVIDGSDDGIWNGYAVQDGVIDVDGDGTYGANDGSDDSDQAYNDLIDMLCVTDPITGELALETLVTWHVPSDAANVCNPTVPDTYGDFTNGGDPIMSSAKCSLTSSSIAVDVVGKLRILKLADPQDPGNPEVFEFTYSNDSPTTADTDPNIPDLSPPLVFPLEHLGFEEIFAEIGTGPATIIITETDIPAGWVLADLQCTGDDLTPVSIDLANKQATVTLEYNEVNPLASQANVICTFVNKTLPSLKVVKNTAGGNGIFTFTGNNGIGGFNLDTLLLNTADTTFTNLQPGTDYSITETIPANWSLNSATCSNGTGASNLMTGELSGVSLSLGENVTCTFNNGLGAISTFGKITVGGDDTFAFTSDLPGLGDFSLTTSGGSSPLASESNIAAGTYTIVESAKAGWDLTALVCTESELQNSTVNVLTRTITLNVEVGEKIACTVSNEAHATLQINKQTDPDGDPALFSFTGDVNGSISDNGTLSYTGPAGVFTTNESATAGWDLTGISCGGGTNSTVLIGGTADFVADDTDVAATMAPGETVTCVYINTKRGSLTIVKSISAVGPPSQDFDFTSDIVGHEAFTLSPADAATDDELVISDLKPGLYSVGETDPTADGWALISSSCGDGSPLNGILLDPGEDLTCTFNNAPLGSTTITKATVGGDGGPFEFTWGNLTNTSTPEGSASTFELTTPGLTASMDFSNKLLIGNPYDLAETNTPAIVGPYSQTWNLTNTECLDATADTLVPGANDADATIIAAAAETVACTFTNTLDGTLVIRKQTLPDGFVEDFVFTGSHVGLTGNLQDFDIAAAELSETGAPGVYGTDETVPTGWVLTDISCTGATSSTVTIGGTPAFVAGDTDVSVNVAAGETVICTYTNTKDGSLTIIKDAIGDSGQFSFNHTVPNITTPFVIDTLVDDTNIISTTLQPGRYMVSEVIPTGWDLTGISCEGATDSTITIGVSNIFVQGDNAVTVDMLSGEDIICTFTNTQQLIINLAKTVDGLATLEADGSYTVLYTITATNTGGSGMYDLVDTFSPGAGITLNTATAAYVAGTENAQTGTLGAYPNFVTDEHLDAGLNESWTVTANFIVDPAVTDPVTSACATAGSAINTGFYNLVTGSTTDTDLTDNDACTALTQPGIYLAKTVDGPAVRQPGGTYSVVYTITATNTAQGSGLYDLIDAFTPGVGITLDTATAVYLAGTESDQSGTLGAYPNFVMGETLAPGADESWTVTAIFSIDMALITAEGNDCDPANAGAENTGFTNGVTGSSTDTDLTDNIACTEFIPPAISLDKTSDVPTYDVPGDVINYDYLITNLGPDVLDSGLSSVVDDKGTVTCPAAAPLLVGDTVTCTASHVITQADLDAGSLTNVATAMVDDVISNEDTVTVTSTSLPPEVPVIPVPVNDKLALLLLTLMLLATGWYFRPATMRRF